MKLTVVMFLMAFSLNSYGEDSENYKKFLRSWTQAWNSADPAEIKLLLSDQFRTQGDEPMSEKDLAEFLKAFAGFQEKTGDITGAELGVWIDKKQRYVVKITYEDMGLIPGTMIVGVNEKGDPLLVYFNIDGQGEPELTQ